MSKIKGLPTREEVSENLTWDLTTLYKDDKEWEKAFESIEELIDKVVSYKGKLGEGSQVFQDAFEANLELSRKLENVYVYAHLKSDEDTNNSHYQAMNDRARSLITKASAATSWFQPELMALSDSEIKSYFDENSDLNQYKHAIETLVANREHVLSYELESTLAQAREIMSASSQTFSMLNNADIEFPTMKDEDGEEVQISHGLYGELLESTDRRVRQEAFEKMYGVYEGLINTFSSTLQNEVKKNNFYATTRNYSSARDRALSANHIPESVHQTLIEVVNENLPLFQKYMDLRKQLLGLDEMHMYDLYTPITGDDTLTYNYDEAKEETIKGLEKLGPEYREILETAFEDRWIDVVENKGKRSGAYSSGSYDSNPYILLNWHDSLNNLYTLVHELGHSVHSYYTHNYQPYVYGDYPIFLAEIASTTNENLLTNYLLEKVDEPVLKAHILNHYLDGFKGTVFRQTQFAEFEHKLHQDAAEGQPLTADYLNSTYYNINKKYYGNPVVSDESIQYEWARIPHFYMNYYVFQYSTGFAAATALANRIDQDEEGALEKYINFLKAGSSDFPIEVMKKAGVDMTDRTYLNEAMKVFEERLNQLEDVMKEITN